MTGTAQEVNFDQDRARFLQPLTGTQTEIYPILFAAKMTS